MDAELRAAGFLDAQLVRHRVAVTRATNTARIDVVWQSGPRYQFGPVHFSDAQFGEDFLRGYLPWRQGDPYSSDELLTLLQRLVDPGYFSVVSVQPDLQQPRDLQVPVNVLLAPDERTVYSAAIGQDLTITQGSLLYASTPLANPSLRITAVRRLRIAGTARSPELSVFSDPSMDDANALSYLCVSSAARARAAPASSIASRSEPHAVARRCLPMTARCSMRKFLPLLATLLFAA